MRTRTLMLLWVHFLLSLSVAVASGADSDLAKLQGTWQGTSPEGARLVLVIKDTTATSTISGKAGTVQLEQQIKLDETADPKALDFLKAGGGSIPGIYKLEGDKLTICLNPLGDERPVKFDAGKAGGSLVVYTRSAPSTLPTAGSAELKPLQGKWQGWMEQAGERQEIVVEVKGNVLTLSQRKGDALAVVGKSELKFDHSPNPKQVYSKKIDFTPSGDSAAKALRGLGLFQISKDLKSWTLAVRPDGKSRPEKISSGQQTSDDELSIHLIRADAPATDSPADPSDLPPRPAKSARPKTSAPRKR